MASLSTPAPVAGRVSIIMPCCNVRPSFLSEAIASIQRQTYAQWELIVIDDGSAMPVAALLGDVVRESQQQIHCITHEPRDNCGISASRNLGLSLASGEFVAFLDADDIWDDTQLEEQVALLQQHSRAAMVYGNTTYWNSWAAHDAEAVHDIRYDIGIPAPQLLQPPEPLRLILERRTISPCMTSLMLRRQVFVDGVTFENEFRAHYEDQVFLAQVFARYPVYLADRVWGRYRQHAGSVTGGDDHSAKALAWRRRYVRWLMEYLETHGLRNTALWRTARVEHWTLQNAFAHSTYWLLVKWLRRLGRVPNRLRGARDVAAAANNP